MRCHYISDLHLETQDFPWRLPRGDVLIVAGDLAHASALDPACTDKYSQAMRSRVLRFTDAAMRNFRHVLLVAGNHDHYDGHFDETVPGLRRALPGVTVLDDECVELNGVRFFGSTLWTDFRGANPDAMNGVRRRLGEYFFVKVRETASGADAVSKFKPEHALAAFERARRKLSGTVSGNDGRATIVITHHAPSGKGLSPNHVGNGLDCAYASDLDDEISAFDRVPFWVHGHTHTRRSYRIGGTTVLANCRGFDGRDRSAAAFSPNRFFDL